MELFEHPWNIFLFSGALTTCPFIKVFVVYFWLQALVTDINETFPKFPKLLKIVVFMYPLLMVQFYLHFHIFYYIIELKTSLGALSKNFVDIELD